MKPVLLLILLCLSLLAPAQRQSDSQLAYNYYRDKEYDKAAEIFLQLYQRTRASYYLDYHIICLINAKRYDEAEVTLRKFLKTDDNNKDFLINLGYIYQQQGKIKKSEEYFSKAVKKLTPNQNDIQNLAYKFRNIREYEWSAKTYEKGRELLKNPQAFVIETGENYMYERNYEAMAEQFMRALEINPAHLNAITSKLSFARNYDINNNVDTVIRLQLQKLQKKPGYLPVFDQLSVWFALQTGNYSEALRHAVLLNQKEPGKQDVFLNIAHEANRSKNYQTAIEAYNHILNTGKENNRFYDIARKEILSSQYTEYTGKQASPSKFQEIATECEAYLKETGYLNSNADILLLLSELYAYKLNQPDTAARLLQKGESIRRLTPATLYTLKSKRADILAFMDNPWEATILYTQIEKANPNNDIGYNAKINKAWMAYYEGDLVWAKAQFDALKGSTTKLISNEAIKMSHFINSNYEKEGDNRLLEQTARTEYMIYKQQYKEAAAALDSLSTHAQPSIADYASLLKAGLLIRENRNAEAVKIYEHLKNNSSETYIKAEAIYKLAQLKQNNSEIQQALELYKQLVSDYSGSVYSVEAGKLYRELDRPN